MSLPVAASTQTKKYEILGDGIYDGYGVNFLADTSFVAKTDLTFENIKDVLAHCVAEPSMAQDPIPTRLEKSRLYKSSQEKLYLQTAKKRLDLAIRTAQSIAQKFQVSEIKIRENRFDYTYASRYKEIQDMLASTDWKNDD